MWAWLDEAAGLIRVRVFAPDDGIPEDEATGSAALQLTAHLGRRSRSTRAAARSSTPAPDDGRAEVGGRVVLDLTPMRRRS